MPELPEVENVKLSLEAQGLRGQVFEKVELLRRNLRTPLRTELQKKLKGQTILAIRRRAKFLLFECEDFILLNHLGMTGAWRLIPPLEKLELLKHDHVILHFVSGFRLVYNDPRRFGLLELIEKEDLPSNRWLKNLGVEPLSDDFTHEDLFRRTRRRAAPIKGFIMDQKQVVGVGNIYASESLFLAGVKPLRPAGKLKRSEAVKLVQVIRQILEQAITAGGSTISSYRNSKGEEGSFQSQFRVYDRKKAPCPNCGSPIKAKIIAGRNTFWCPKCQR